MTQYLSVISDKFLEKITTGIFSVNSMNANEPKRILSDNNMLLQYGFMFNFQCHFKFLRSSRNLKSFCSCVKSRNILQNLTQIVGYNIKFRQSSRDKWNCLWALQCLVSTKSLYICKITSRQKLHGGLSRYDHLLNTRRWKFNVSFTLKIWISCNIISSGVGSVNNSWM